MLKREDGRRLDQPRPRSQACYVHEPCKVMGGEDRNTQLVIKPTRETFMGCKLRDIEYNFLFCFPPLFPSISLLSIIESSNEVERELLYCRY